MRSLRFQFVGFVAALLILLLVLLNTYPIISSRDAVFEEKLSSLPGRASAVASSLSSLDKLSRESVAEVLRFLDVSGFARIVVVDHAGLVVYDTGGPTGSQTDIGDILRALENSKTVFRSVFSGKAFSSSMVTPLSAEGTITGAVYLYEYDAERAEVIFSFQNRLRALSIGIAVFALATVGIFSALIMRRLQELVRSMRAVAAGDYGHRHVIKGQDEIAELGEEFNLLTERLESTEQQRRRFVSDASHELKTPLASIRLLSDSIVQNEDMPPDTVREFVTDIGNEAQRLQRTTEKLLELSRLDDNTVKFSPEPVDVKQAALDALVFLRPLAKEKQVHIKSELDEGCVVMASQDHMFQIIFNLIENAIKYNVPEGSVTLSLKGLEDGVELSVEDTGIGIPEEDRPQIFSRFYRVDKARSREAGGSGLGLSIVHDAVSAYGGSITVEQNKPQGSRFIVRFPRPTSEETGI